MTILKWLRWRGCRRAAWEAWRICRGDAADGLNVFQRLIGLRGQPSLIFLLERRRFNSFAQIWPLCAASWCAVVRLNEALTVASCTYPLRRLHVPPPLRMNDSLSDLKLRIDCDFISLFLPASVHVGTNEGGYLFMYLWGELGRTRRPELPSSNPFWQLEENRMQFDESWWCQWITCLFVRRCGFSGFLQGDFSTAKTGLVQLTCPGRLRDKTNILWVLMR